MNDTWWVKAADLDADQKAILASATDEKLLVAGPPGSGKTNILLLRANYVKAQYPRTLFLTFTRTLAEFIKSGPSIGRADQIQQTDVMTFMSWGKKFLRDSGQDVTLAGSFNSQREALADQLLDYVSSKNIGIYYDAVFIDEVQDFLKTEIDILARLSKTMNAAGDARQTIWKHKQGLAAMQVHATQTVELKNHYRIGAKICEAADRILPPPSNHDTLTKNCKYDEEARPSSVISVPCLNKVQQYQFCIDKIRQQIRYISEEPILILSHRNQTRDEFFKMLANDPELSSRSMIQSSDGYDAFVPDEHVRVMTIASAKGSEARAVHILEADQLGPALRELAFTAVTRAKTEVVLYHSGVLAGHIEPPKLVFPEIDRLF